MDSIQYMSFKIPFFLSGYPVFTASFVAKTVSCSLGGIALGPLWKISWIYECESAPGLFMMPHQCYGLNVCPHKLTADVREVGPLRKLGLDEVMRVGAPMMGLVPQW